ncbi:MAG: 50S ribosome-binding GTPase [Saprospiraceae bacterium]|nr:50S ribosome-binding GTPase [Candidatus Vicinibacter affinis]
MASPKIAFVGNPNCGKSSLFNLLTGLIERVAEFPGCDA